MKGESESHELLRISHRRARKAGTLREQKREGGKMKEKQVKLPGPDHPISIERNPARVVVSVAGRIPVDDVDFSQLEPTEHFTYCPYKGDCNYYSVPAGGRKSVNAVWSYEDPFPAVAQIRGHVAFYPERVDEIAEQFPT